MFATVQLKIQKIIQGCRKYKNFTWMEKNWNFNRKCLKNWNCSTTIHPVVIAFIEATIWLPGAIALVNNWLTCRLANKLTDPIDKLDDWLLEYWQNDLLHVV